MGRLSLAAVVGLLWACAATWAIAGDLPAGFSYLSEIDPSIRQDIRYAGPRNFTRRPVPGYQAAECLLATSVAKALSQVQKDALALGLTLIVFDCYRPVRAVRDFAEWGRHAKGLDAEYNPKITSDRLLAEGYIAARSSHSSGGTVDLTLGLDGTPLEIGTDFDFFDPTANTGSKQVSPTAGANRRRLVALMKRSGFTNYWREWWHFTFEREPFATRAFDFPIVPPR